MSKMRISQYLAALQASIHGWMVASLWLQMSQTLGLENTTSTLQHCMHEVLAVLAPCGDGGICMLV